MAAIGDQYLGICEKTGDLQAGATFFGGPHTRQADDQLDLIKDIVECIISQRGSFQFFLPLETDFQDLHIPCLPPDQFLTTWEWLQCFEGDLQIGVSAESAGKFDLNR